MLGGIANVHIFSRLQNCEKLKNMEVLKSSGSFLTLLLVYFKTMIVVDPVEEVSPLMSPAHIVEKEAPLGLSNAFF